MVGTKQSRETSLRPRPASQHTTGRKNESLFPKVASALSTFTIYEINRERSSSLHHSLPAPLLPCPACGQLACDSPKSIVYVCQ